MKVAKEIVSACQNVGFAYITNHGIPAERLAEAFAWSKRFFDLTPEQKLQAPHPNGSSIHRGYSWPGLEKVSQEMGDKDMPELIIKKLRAIPDYKESYDMGSNEDSHQPNVWIPEDTLPGFRSFMMEFYWECFTVASDILRAISIGIGLGDEHHLLKLHSGHNNQLRLLHYPPLPAAALENERYARMPAHTDWSSITILFQDDCGGLEVENIKRPGQFIRATPIENALVMNVGDLLQRWSNDNLRSTSHRVTMPPFTDTFDGPNRMVKERYSIPYFIAPDPTSVIECLPSCISPSNPPKYLPISQSEYNLMRARMHYPNTATEAGSGQAY
ncbi:thymine dioxygenase [Histoplasma capsulatum G186AR]|uniref:Thymine dioxygenase n=1 Tax=Ajellomyces capsulatus (strain G186AR / H82 / ATCC MYA-2454 / RMSCC 2432) TaxID=447093 RepID=C0NMU9_AJECG|nr:thymine dioxygenase [Histoplasma capsulatum G186AR]EEH07197.1 thymine dioxygenase [Histoplasma capsulatum G186AR]